MTVSFLIYNKNMTQNYRHSDFSAQKNKLISLGKYQIYCAMLTNQ